MLARRATPGSKALLNRMRRLAVGHCTKGQLSDFFSNTVQFVKYFHPHVNFVIFCLNGGEHGWAHNDGANKSHPEWASPT